MNDKKIIRTEKINKKMFFFVHFPCLLPDLWSLKLSKKVHFLKFCADLSKKSKSIKAIYVHATERSCCTITENGIVYSAMTYLFGDIRI